jgi:hypothetical protein
VAAAPELTIVPANSSVSLAGNYTLVMADADVVGTNESVGQTRHWLVNGVTLKNGTLPRALPPRKKKNISFSFSYVLTVSLCPPRHFFQLFFFFHPAECVYYWWNGHHGLRWACSCRGKWAASVRLIRPPPTGDGDLSRSAFPPVLFYAQY